MKRWIALCLTLFALTSLTACGGTPPASGGDQDDENTPENVDTPETGDGACAEAEAYGEILDHFYALISDGDGDWDAGEGETGVLEVLAQGGGLGDIGYAIVDLSGDGVPELLIGGLEQHGAQGCFGSDLYAVYAAPEGVPVLVCEGWARDSLRWLGENRFLRIGSDGAMCSMFGTYALSEDGAAMNCEDFWFTYEKDASYTKMGFYQNNSGMWDPAMSRELDMTEADFWRLEEELEAQVRAVDLTPFSVYEPYAWMPVRAQWADEALETGIAYDAVTVDTSDAAARVLFSTGDGVKDFRLLALELEDVSESGAVTFSAREVYRQDALTPERPLVVELTFYGDIPSYGIACVDASGAQRRFTVEVSGKDGSLLLWETGEGLVFKD